MGSLGANSKPKQTIFWSLWVGLQVLALVVERGRNRGAEHRQRAQQALDTVSTWASAEVINDVMMLDYDEFCAHHKSKKGWDQQHCDDEWISIVNDPGIKKEEEAGVTTVPVKMPKRYRGVVGKGVWC